MSCCSQPFVKLVFPKHKIKLVGGQLSSPLMQNSTRLSEFALTGSMQTSPSTLLSLALRSPVSFHLHFLRILGFQKFQNGMQLFATDLVTSAFSQCHHLITLMLCEFDAKQHKPRYF